MKLLVKLVALVVVALVVLVLARNVVIKAAVENGVRIVTGMPLSMGKLDLNFQKSFVDIEDLVVKNPSGFHDTALVEIPKIFVGYDLLDMFKGKVHLRGLEFDMKQFTVVKNEKGELNLDRLKALEGTRKASPQTTKQAPEAKPMPIQIDLMRLKIGKVAYVDYSNGKPATKEFLINLDQSYQNITDLNSVVRLIVLKAMMSSGISNLTNFNTAALEGGLVNILATGKGTAGKVAAQGLKVLMATAQNPGQTAGDAGTTLQNTLGMLGHTGKSAGGTVTNVASALKKKIRIPF